MRAEALQQRFADLLERHGISLATPRGMVRCLFHDEKTPSLSIDIERCLFHCFGCGIGGGVKDFALAVGEPWGKICHNLHERTRFAVQARRREAEAQAKAIFERIKGERDDRLWARWCAAHTEATSAAELLSLFFRHPHLAEEFPALVKITESEYDEAVFRRMLVEQQFAGEVEHG